ncbi:MAG: ATP-binding protein [Candidatus Gracilibacteria bacterium]|nr:ATP-binding protein [Candidatus Gracilibacteria bacterium]
MRKLIELFKNRFYLLLFFATIFIVGNYFITGNFLPTTDTKDLWFYSGLFMILFSILFIEPYYTSPKNVITNTIPLLLVFLSIETTFEPKIIWNITFCILLLLLILSIIPLALNDENKSPEHGKNQVANFLKRIVVILGKGKIIYSATFLLFLYINITSTPSDDFKKIFDAQFIFLMVLWGLILSINPKELNNTFSFKKKELDKNAIGEIFGIQSKKIFLVRLFEDRKSIKKFDIVKFRYSMQDSDDLIMMGIVFDTYLLNQEKWAKVLQLGEIKKDILNLEKNVVHKILDKTEKFKIETDLKVKDFVGIIVNGSNIGKIKFEYSKKNNDLEEGNLIELKLDFGNIEKRLFYQVINGYTEKEKLENKNEMGFIQGEAIQLGEWQNEKLSFQKFGWVPSINTPIFKANTDNISVQNFEYPNYKLGNIPNTSLPSVINLNEAVSHHMALLGVTGSGKSFLAREIIQELNNNDTKVICIDFNNEFVQELNPVPETIISDTESKNIFTEIEKLNTELAKFENQQNQTIISECKVAIYNKFKIEIEAFLNATDKKIKIFELPEISNNRNSLDYTRYFFDTLFKIVKDYYKGENAKKISIVLEEAHTVIPEWNFAGASDKTSQSLVNNIGQIALQGRKYGIGFLVIAQRTANVSKTVLTQCNTVICFQAFDETSIGFLGNYIGKDLVQTLPNLKQYHAIVTGKAIKSNIPMIIDLKRG